MGIWIGDAREFEELREENERLKERVAHLERLLKTSEETIDLALSESERALLAQGAQARGRQGLQRPHRRRPEDRKTSHRRG